MPCIWTSSLQIQVSFPYFLFSKFYYSSLSLFLFRTNQYIFRTEYNLPVPVPLETASNMEEVRLYNEQKKAAMEAGQPL